MAAIMNDKNMTQRMGGLVAPQARMDSDASLRDILLTLWRRKIMILTTVFVMVGVTAAIMMILTPTFTATTSMAMERRGINVGNLDRVASGLPGDESTFKSEIEVLRSRDLAAAVVSRLDLTSVSEFNKALRPSSGWMTMLRSKLSFLNKADKQNKTDEDRLELERIATTDEFLRNLDVIPIGLVSRVMAVSFTSRDPELAATVSNTLAEIYIENQLETKAEAASQASELLKSQVAVLRQRLVNSESVVEDYRRQSGLLVGKDVTLTAQQTAEVNSLLVLAEAAWAEAEARYQQIRTLSDSSDGAGSAADVLDSELVKTLREQQSTIERNRAELSMEYGPLHPAMIKLEAEREDLERTIQAEMSKIVQGYDNKVKIARARYESMQKSLDNLEKEIGQANRDEIGLRTLEREARANQLILESFLTETKETIAEQGLGMFSPDAKIISHADVPLKSSFPKIKLFMALAAVGSAFAGVLLVFLVENLDQGLRSAKEIEETLGVPLLALVPVLKGVRLTPATPASYVAENPTSALAQSIRTVHLGITLSRIQPDPKTIVITSSEPGEGKTTTSACLARVRAAAGARVVVVDFDFHRAGIAEALEVENGAGIADVLAGKAMLAEVIRKDEKSGASYITSGNVTPESTGSLDIESAKRIFAILSSHFEMIIVDSPPLMAMVESRMLTSVADATVLVVRWAHTKRDIVSLCLRQIHSAGGKLAGIVLSQVDVKKNSKFGYPDSGAYHGALSSYYHN